MNNPIVLNWVKEQAAQAKLVLSVCTGSLILGKAGLLEGLEATTHFKAMDGLREISDQIHVKENVRFIDNGTVITSAGIVLAATFAVLGVLPLVFLAELGFAVAFGVLLDTLIVRTILVPALVHDIGGKVWWPSKLQNS